MVARCLMGDLRAADRGVGARSSRSRGVTAGGGRAGSWQTRGAGRGEFLTLQEYCIRYAPEGGQLQTPTWGTGAVVAGGGGRGALGAGGPNPVRLSPDGNRKLQTERENVRTPGCVKSRRRKGATSRTVKSACTKLCNDVGSRELFNNLLHTLLADDEAPHRNSHWCRERKCSRFSER